MTELPRILVTGGTGAFGQAFVRRQLEADAVERIVVYSRDEHKQERMAREFGSDPQDRLRFFLGDVRDIDRLEMAMRAGITHVVHAAALKIVPWCEYNPSEAISTNIGGARNIVDASIRASTVERVVALSSDKACSPVNLYGATKLAAEKLMLAANALGGGRVRFSAVRYGNVSGSTGSVIPLWRTKAREHEPLPMTDGAMTRYWMLLGEAITLVEDVLVSDRAGQVVIPKLPSYRIRDLAEAVWIEQWGTAYLGPLPLDQIGIRPGEKIHESMISEDEAPWAWDCGTHYEIVPEIGGGVQPGGALPGLEASTDTRTKVPDGFRYRSDENERWLRAEDLVKRLKTVAG